MSDPPRGGRLLQLARDALLRDLLKSLPKDRQLDARMIANAMAIAERELWAAERGAAQTGAKTAVSEKLAVEVRAGRHDGDEVTHRMLVERARDRLAIANPKALRMDETD